MFQTMSVNVYANKDTSVLMGLNMSAHLDLTMMNKDLPHLKVVDHVQKAIIVQLVLLDPLKIVVVVLNFIVQLVLRDQS